jgi:hypothetical protein
MKRSLVTLTFGLIVGIGAHWAYYGHHRHIASTTLEGQLAWMKTELRLTDSQFERIKELHQASHPRLREMAAQVANMHAEFAEFERARRTSDRVDFLEFARFIQSRRELNRECLDSTRQLILASAEVMTPEQRQHYIRLVATAEPNVGSLLN